MRVLVVLVVSALLVVACADEEPGAGKAVDLKVSVDDGKGTVARATLTCDGDATGSGFLEDRADEHCRAVQDLERLLTAKVPSDRVCTQLYGGPQTAHVSGRFAGKAVDRDLGRRDGCQIADWDRAAPLVSPSGVRVGP